MATQEKIDIAASDASSPLDLETPISTFLAMTSLKPKPNPNPNLKELLNSKSKEDASTLGRFVILTNAAMMDANFTLINGSQMHLHHDWDSQAPSPCLEYTISDSMDQFQAINEKVVVLTPSVVGSWITIHGHLSRSNKKFYHFSFDFAKVASLLSLDMSSISKSEQEKLMKLFRSVKDTVAQPLMIDLCLKNGLALPPCFMLLPNDLKARILDFLPGVDVARVGSTCKEMRNLISGDSTDENLWRHKMEKEFAKDLEHPCVRSVLTWRRKYKAAYNIKKMGLRFKNQSIPGYFLPVSLHGIYDPWYSADHNELLQKVIRSRGPYWN